MEKFEHRKRTSNTITVDWILAFTIGPTMFAPYYTRGSLRLAHRTGQSWSRLWDVLWQSSDV